ncbi:MAG: hypothetical protein KatS3mg090_0621 [Patescibacteria group bacterium]|nr:MAG: hypothetical protein KatS3mg090_0621 [Patescibacteria group bacterium]
MKIKHKRNKSKILIIFIFILFGLGLTLRTIKLSKQPFYDWDEGIYAQVGKEIIQNKNIKTTFNGTVWLNKPPLLHLITAFALKLSKTYEETNARLVITVFSFLVILLTYKLTLKLTNNKLLSLLSTALLLSSKTYIERSSILNTDIIIGLSWIGYVYFIDKFWIKTFFLVLGVWSKSLVGFFPLVYEIINFVHKNKKVTISKIRIFLATVFIQVGIASLWYFYAYLNFGDYFLKAHFYDQIFKRVIKPIESHFGNNLGLLYYPYLFWNDSKILTLLSVTSIVTILYNLIHKLKKIRFNFIKLFYNLNQLELLVVFYLPFLLLLTISKSKIYWYITFILPLLSITAVSILLKIKKKIIYWLIFITVFLFSLTSFLQQTIFYNHKVSTNERYVLAECVKEESAEKLAYLMKESERLNYRFLKENDLDTATTFIYGGSPSFVYYSNKKPDFYYEEKKFVKNYRNYPIVIIQKVDYLNLGIDTNDYELKCETNNQLDHKKWLVFVKK